MKGSKKPVLRSLLALLLPVIALVLLRLLARTVHPHVWFLLYPAVFISSWIGGRRLGVIATVLGAFLVAWFVMRPAGELTLELGTFLQIGVFVATGVGFAIFHERATRALAGMAARQQLDADYRAMVELHEQLKQVNNQRRVFAALIDNSSDFIGIADAEGKVIYVNPAGRRMVGLSADHPIGETQISDYYPPGERSFASNVIVKATVEKGQWQGEVNFRNWQTEQAIPISHKNFTIRDPNTGEALGMATISRDISDLRKVNDELRRTNSDLIEVRKFLEDVLESSTEYSIIAKDLERRIVAWNKGAEGNYGYAAGEIVGRSSDVLHVPEELQSGVVAALHERALAEGHATGLFRRRRKDGAEFLARVMITRRNDASGKAIGYLLVSHDVVATEQRHVAQQRFLAHVGEALQASLDFDTTIERIAELMVSFMCDCCVIDVVDGDGTLRRVNVSHVDPAKEPLAEGLVAIVPPATHPIWRVMETKQTLLFGEVMPDLLRFIAKDEEHLRLLYALNPLSIILLPLVARGRIMAVVTIASCRSDRRYVGEDLRLAEEVGRRASLALDNAHLYELAREAVLARDRVMGLVAHDLRNPLGTILLQTSRLRRPGDGPEQVARKPADAIERAATRMNRLIQDLLDVARMDAGGLPIERARIPTGQIVSESVETQQALATAADLELRHDVEEYLPVVWGDRDRLVQVFENLIGNAIKFTDPGGRILVRATSRNREVLFSVHDTGPGIAAEDLPRVFERHWRARTTENQGAGLGLAIVKSIVEAHGGRIWVESTLGQGSTFFFTIPTTPPAQEWHPGLS